MTAVPTVLISYFGYAAMLAIGAVCWLGALARSMIYRRVDAGLLDPAWQEAAFWLSRNLRYAILAACLCALAAFLTALWPAGGDAAVVKAHKAYQLRYGAIALCFVGLIFLAEGRMGEFDAEAAAVVVFAWALWLLVAAWRALAAGTAVGSPALWWLALAADAIGLVVAVLVVILLNTRMRLF